MSDTETRDAEVIEAEMLESGIDMQEVDRARKDSMLKAGTWQTVAGAVNVGARETKDGRKFFSVFGTAQMGEEEGKIRFSFSPERRNKLVDGEDSGKPDHMTKLHAQVISAYVKAHGEGPKNYAQVKEYLENAPVKVRLGQGDEDNIVFSISPVLE